MYYEFRVDGTFSYVTQQETGAFSSSNWTVLCGNWSMNKDIVNMTKSKLADWFGTEEQPKNMAWKDVGNTTMCIEMREPDFVEYSVRYFINHSIVAQDLKTSHYPIGCIWVNKGKNASVVSTLL